MLRVFCRQLKPIHQQISRNNLNTLSMRNATLLFEMRSGRVGKISLDSQKEFDKILERYNNIGNFCKILIVFLYFFVL